MHDFAPHPRITVLTGAGISTSSGIPDFRGPDGTWTRRPQEAELLDLHRYMADPDVRRRSWLSYRDHPAWAARPTAAHRALADLGRTGHLRALLTQNFDGLHQAAGSTGVVELHGTMVVTRCTRCGAEQPTRDVLARTVTEPDPPCRVCDGILRPAVVMFGEPLDDTAIERAVAACVDADVLLAIGTTLTVQPVASLAGVAVDAGAELIIVNAEPTPSDHLAARVLRDPIDQVVPALLRELVPEP